MAGRPAPPLPTYYNMVWGVKCRAPTGTTGILPVGMNEPRHSIIFCRGGGGGDEGWRGRAAYVLQKHGAIAAKMKSALGPLGFLGV